MATVQQEALARRPLRKVAALAEQAAGGRARGRAVVLFGCVLALESADLGTIGAVAPELERAFQISRTQLGLLASVSLIVTAIATLPFGW
jgi:hypothetical protein